MWIYIFEDCSRKVAERRAGPLFVDLRFESSCMPGMLVIVTIVNVTYRVIIRDQAMEMSDLEGIKRKNWS